MDTAYVRENQSPKWPHKIYKVQYLHFGYLKLLVMFPSHCVSHGNLVGGWVSQPIWNRGERQLGNDFPNFLGVNGEHTKTNVWNHHLLSESLYLIYTPCNPWTAGSPTNHPFLNRKWSSKTTSLCSMLIFRGVVTRTTSLNFTNS